MPDTKKSKAQKVGGLWNPFKRNKKDNKKEETSQSSEPPKQETVKPQQNQQHYPRPPRPTMPQYRMQPMMYYPIYQYPMMYHNPYQVMHYPVQRNIDYGQFNAIRPGQYIYGQFLKKGGKKKSVDKKKPKSKSKDNKEKKLKKARVN